MAWPELEHRLTQTELADWKQTHESGNTNHRFEHDSDRAAQYTRCTLPKNTTQQAAAVVSESTNHNQLPTKRHNSHQLMLYRGRRRNIFKENSRKNQMET